MPDVSVALRTQVRDRAGRRCEYCLAPESVTLIEHEVDHIIALKHGGHTIAENLALCCTLLSGPSGRPRDDTDTPVESAGESQRARTNDPGEAGRRVGE